MHVHQSLVPRGSRVALALATFSLSVLAACGGGGGEGPTAGSNSGNAAVSDGSSSNAAVPTVPTVPPLAGVGNAQGRCAVPLAAQPAVLANPRVIGTGTPASCTGDAVVAAVAQGGAISFNCGPDPVTITLNRTAKVFNNRPDVVLDGGGKVTLSGGGRVRILYQNTCDQAQVWTSAECDKQTSPQLTLQNIHFEQGNSIGQGYGLERQVYGGGAVYVRGGQLRVVNSRFSGNQCESVGPDVGGGAVRVFGANASIVNSTFTGNRCSNGGALSGLGGSYSVYNSTLAGNQATGRGQNPIIGNNPGEGSGGAIYNDGNFLNLQLCGTEVRENTAVEGGGAIFYVSNDRTGLMSLTDSVLTGNLSGTFETAGLPGIFILAAPGQPVLRGTRLSP